MAKERLINTRFWNDSWVRTINPLDRYLYLYLLTNEYTNISGIYELPVSTIAYSSGLDERDLRHTMLPRLEPKVFYKDGWIILINFPKYQRIASDKVVEGIVRCLKEAPKHIVEFAKDKGYGYDMDMIWVSYHIPLTKPLTKPLLGESKDSQGKKKLMKKNHFNYKENNHEDAYEEVIDLETGQKSEKKVQTKKYPNARTVFALFGKYPLNWKINKTQLQSAENLFSERGVEQIIKALSFLKEHKNEEFCPVVNSPYDLDSKWAKIISFKKKI